ncbi:MAG: hypothetical protein U0165_14780 [Polyangiaceae bacterium]
MLSVRYASIAVFSLCGVGVSAVAGCGTPPPQPKPVTTATASVAEPTPAPPEPDLSPVAEPKNLVGVGKWKSAGVTVDALKKMLAGSKLGKEFNREVDRALPQDMMKSLMLESSIDISIALDPASRDDNPEFFFAFSVPFRSVEDVKSRENVVEIKPGIYKLGNGKAKGMQCVAARSLGDAPIRLVCGQHEKDLDALLPWMTRGMPNAAIAKSDFHLELRAAPLQDRYKTPLEQAARFAPGLAAGQLSRELGIDDPIIAEITRDVVNDGVLLASDLDKFSFDVGFDPNGSGVTAGSTLKFKSKNSWFARAVTANNGKAGAPPAIFWQAPSDSDTAAYNQGADPKLWAPVLKSLGSLVTIPLAKVGVAAADRDALKGVIADMPVNSAASTVSATVVTAGVADSVEGSRQLCRGDQALATALGLDVELERDGCGCSCRRLREVGKGYRGLQPTWHPGLAQEGCEGHQEVDVPTVRTCADACGLPKGTVVLEFGVNIDSSIMREDFLQAKLRLPGASSTSATRSSPRRCRRRQNCEDEGLAVAEDRGDARWGEPHLDRFRSRPRGAQSAAALGQSRRAEGQDHRVASWARHAEERLANLGGFLSFGGIISVSRARQARRCLVRAERRARVSTCFDAEQGSAPGLLLGTGTNDKRHQVRVRDPCAEGID